MGYLLTVFFSVQFATFESAVAQIYKTLGGKKEDYTTVQQTGVSFLGGYIAGTLFFVRIQT